jgi:hypothetical protein
VWYAGNCDISSGCDELGESIARTVLESGEDLSRFDGMIIQIVQKIDLGWATFNLWANKSASIDDWQEQLGITD